MESNGNSKITWGTNYIGKKGEGINSNKNIMLPQLMYKSTTETRWLRGSLINSVKKFLLEK